MPITVSGLPTRTIRRGLAGSLGGAAAQWAVLLPGTAGNYISTPDSVVNSITGDIDIRVKVALDDWTSTTLFQSLISKFGGAASNAAFMLRMSGTAGRPQFRWSVDGTTILSAVATAAVPFAAGATGWVRVTFDVDNGAGGNTATFLTSTDGITWTALGSPVTTAGVTSIFDSTAAMELGGAVGGTNAVAGTIFYAEVRNGIAGPIAAKYDSSAVAVSGVRTPATVTTTWANPGQADQTTVWTINGSAWSWQGAAMPARLATVLDLPGTAGNYASTPDSVGNSVTGDLDLRCKVTLDDWTPAANQSLIVKWNTTSNQRAYVFQMQTTGKLAINTSADGAAGLGNVSSVATGLADGSTKWVRVTLDVDDGGGNRVAKFYTSDDGSTWAQLGTNVTTAGATAVFDSTAVLTVGATANDLEHLAGLVHYAEVRRGIDGPVVALFDATAVAKTATRTPTTTVQGGGPNLLTPNQASIETDTTGWASGGANTTIARSTAQFLDGAASLSLTAVGIGVTNATSTATTVPVTVGQSYTAKASFRAATAGRAVQLRIAWYTAALGFISETTVAGTDVTTGWTEVTSVGVAPATAAYGRVNVVINDATQLATEVHYVDRVSLVQTPSTWTVNGAAWDWATA